MKTRKIFYALPLVFLLVGCGCKDDIPDTNEAVEEKKEERADLTPAKELDENFDVKKFETSPVPFGINVSYYSDIYSRGFSWFTDNTVEDTKLYLVESPLNYNADFSNAKEYDGKCIKAKYTGDGGGFTCDDENYKDRSGSGGTTVEINSHKVHVEDLKPDTQYSYKIGSDAGWKYGAFTTEVENPKEFTAIQISDAQTYDAEKLTVYRNTIKEAVKTAGKDLDFVLQNGDQFDGNMKSVDGNKINQILRFTKANDVLEDYKTMIPFMNAAGNHETNCPYSHSLGMDVNWGPFDYKGGNYSYSYGNAHIIVLNSNRLSDSDATDEKYLAQLNWLKEDLASDSFKQSKWRIVMMHIACYSTGDHSNDSANQKLVERLTPLFSENHIDLVLQAHDHTYNKTLPYKWDAAGYSTTYNNADVVNFDVQKKTIDGREYDDNPQGTYYVTTGAAGHRSCSYLKDGKHEYEDGIWSEVKVDGEGNINPADSSKTYRNNKYKCEVGKLTQASQFNSFTTNNGVEVSGTYNIGAPATACVDGQMFGLLKIKENTLTYDSYYIKAETGEVGLFDTLSIYR